MMKFNDIITIQARIPDAKSNIIKGRFKIRKTEGDKMQAFGWANIAVTEGGEQIEDYHEDLIDPEELEQAAYSFVELYREGGEMHERGGCAVLIESMVFTKKKQSALGIAEGTLPEERYRSLWASSRLFTGTDYRCRGKRRSQQISSSGALRTFSENGYRTSGSEK